MDGPTWLDAVAALAGEDPDLADGVLRTGDAEVGALASPAGDTWPVWQCCVLYDGRPQQDVPVAAPSAELALASLRQLVDRVNRHAAAAGYPAALSAAGPCAR